MLMWYACTACWHKERIWNSRDGVTPFGLGCSSCGAIMNHVDWQADEYAPNHKLHRGQRFWRDGTPDEAEAIMRRRIESMRDQYPLPPEEEERLIRGARDAAETADDNFHEFQKGWPMLDIYDRAG